MTPRVGAGGRTLGARVFAFRGVKVGMDGGGCGVGGAARGVGGGLLGMRPAA